MTLYLMDTDHSSPFIIGKGADYGMILLRVSEHSGDDFHFSIVSFHEQALGAHNLLNKARKPKDLEPGYELLGSIQRGYGSLPMLPFDMNARLEYENLLSLKTGVGTMDLRIAGIAISRDMTLLTRNARDFSKIPGLKFEDWTV